MVKNDAYPIATLEEIDLKPSKPKIKYVLKKDPRNSYINNDYKKKATKTLRLNKKPPINFRTRIDLKNHLNTNIE